MTIKMIVPHVLLLLLIVNKEVQCKKILFFYPMMSKSILITFAPLAEELRDRGHEVTTVSLFSLGMDNITEIVCNASGHFPYSEASKSAYRGDSIWKLYNVFVPYLLSLANESLTNKQMSKLIADPKTEFDAVITDINYINIMGVYLAHRFNASLVLYFSKMMSSVDMNEAMLQPHNPAYMPHPLHQHGTQMNFKERTANVLLHWFYALMGSWLAIPQVEEILDKALPDQHPELRPRITELIKSPSLSLHLGHKLILDGNRPTVPNFVQIGMLNCRPIDYTKTMTGEVRKIMDESTNGVIYISFGTFLKSSEIQREELEIFINVISELKETVLWKWETESLEGAPENLHLFTWLPQKEILNHPNLKLFISHGGQASYQEILCFQKPALFMPIRSDQFTNSQDGYAKGIGLVLPYMEITEEKFSKYLKVMLNDCSFSEQAKYWGNLLMDEKEHPMDRAVWWLEYVMRHKHVRHFKSPVGHLNYLQANLIDVYLFLGFGLLSLFFVVYKLLRFAIYCFSCRKNKGKVD